MLGVLGEKTTMVSLVSSKDCVYLPALARYLGLSLVQNWTDTESSVSDLRGSYLTSSIVAP